MYTLAFNYFLKGISDNKKCANSLHNYTGTNLNPFKNLILLLHKNLILANKIIFGSKSFNQIN